MGKVLDNQCPNCKAPIVLDPKSGKFKCDYCGGIFTANQVRDMNKTKAKDEEEAKKNPRVKEDGKYVSYNCPDCGATVVADENTAATFCLYCGNTQIIKNRLSGKFEPSKLIPFKTDLEDAKKALISLKKGRPFMPKTFNDPKNIEKITGIYIPFWLYEVDSNGSIECNAQRITTWVVGDRHFTKTDTYKVVRSGDLKFHRIPVDGSKRFDNDVMNTIEPFNYDELVDYNHAYLAGFLAEKYDVEDEEAYVDAAARALESTKNEFVKDIKGFTTVHVSDNNLAASKTNVEYVLLPVYMVNIKWQDKFYLFAMNAQTGEFVGNIPIDKKKVVVFSIILFVILALIVFGIDYLIYLGGH